MIRITHSPYLRAKDFNVPSNYFFRWLQRRNLSETTVQVNIHERDSVHNDSESEVEKNSNMISHAISKVYNESPLNDLKSEYQKVSPVENYIKAHRIFKYSTLNNSTFDEDELSPTVSIKQAIQILKQLSMTKNRPIKLLRSISEKLITYPKNVDLIKCSDIIYSLATLSYKDKDLLDKVAQDILQQKSDFVRGGFLPASLLHSIGILKYRNVELIEVLLKAISENNGIRRTQDFLTGLMTLAVLNVSSPYFGFFLNELSSCRSTDFNDTKSYLNLVWASVLLNHFSPEHISVVLSERFVNQMKATQNTMQNLKLLNVNAAATTFLESYTGPRLKKTNYLVPQSKSKSMFLMSVIDSLSHVFPNEGYISTGIDTGAGFLLDVECFMDSQGNLVSWKKRKEPHVKKIGILLLEFKDFCLDEQKTLCGLSHFKQTLLEAKGYKVVTVPYTEYDSHVKLSQKVQYLEKKLKDASHN